MRIMLRGGDSIGTLSNGPDGKLLDAIAHEARLAPGIDWRTVQAMVGDMLTGLPRIIRADAEAILQGLCDRDVPRRRRLRKPIDAEVHLNAAKRPLYYAFVAALDPGVPEPDLNERVERLEREVERLNERLSSLRVTID